MALVNFSEADLQRLRDMGLKLDGLLVNDPLKTEQDHTTMSPEVYVAKLPDTGIPQAEYSESGTVLTPGSVKCDIYRISTLADTVGELTEIVEFQKLVYNLSPWGFQDIDTSDALGGGDCGYIPVIRDAYGNWIAQHTHFPPVEFVSQGFVYDSEDPFSGSVVKFSANDPGRLNLRAYNTGCSNCTVFDDVQAGAAVVNGSTYNGPSVNLDCGYWEFFLDCPVSISSWSGNDYTTYETDEGDSVDIYHTYAAYVTVLVGARPDNTVNWREVRKPLYPLLYSSRFSSGGRCQVREFAYIPASVDLEELGIWFKGSGGHTYSIDQDRTRVGLRRINPNPVSMRYANTFSTPFS